MLSIKATLSLVYLTNCISGDLFTGNKCLLKFDSYLCLRDALPKSQI